jgi:hypothetical protein
MRDNGKLCEDRKIISELTLKKEYERAWTNLAMVGAQVARIATSYGLDGQG